MMDFRIEREKEEDSPAPNKKKFFLIPVSRVIATGDDGEVVVVPRSSLTESHSTLVTFANVDKDDIVNKIMSIIFFGVIGTFLLALVMLLMGRIHNFPVAFVFFVAGCIIVNFLTISSCVYQLRMNAKACESLSQFPQCVDDDEDIAIIAKASDVKSTDIPEAVVHMYQVATGDPYAYPPPANGLGMMIDISLSSPLTHYRARKLLVDAALRNTMDSNDFIREISSLVDEAL